MKDCEKVSGGNNMSLVHIYCGDGKGKTTASVGLAVRAAGSGKKVLFTQFFKNGTSSEISVLKSLPNVTVNVCEKKHKFFFRMNEEERECAKEDYEEVFRKAVQAVKDGVGLLVLDEAVSACNHGMLEEAEVIRLLKDRGETEIVLTGRDPSQALQEEADYISEVRKIKHPFDKGIKARKGIEF